MNIIRWTACETYTWVAFREARPIGDDIEFPAKEWSRDWKRWPPKWLSNAFVEIATGVPWKPDREVVYGPSAETVRARARQIIHDTGETARQLNDLLATDIKRCGCNQDKLRQAFRDVMAAVRAGRLAVLARPAGRYGESNISATHQVLDPELFVGPRAINLFGVVDYAGLDTNVSDPRQENGFAFLYYNGPWFDEARFDAGRVRALWPASTLSTTKAEILAWLTNDAETFLREKGAKPKREDLVRDCVAALRCRYEDAEAACSQLPDHLRRRRGERGDTGKSAG